jgi:hypothetical protein
MFRRRHLRDQLEMFYQVGRADARAGKDLSENDVSWIDRDAAWWSMAYAHGYFHEQRRMMTEELDATP